MKRNGLFEWTPKADVAFQDHERYLTSQPLVLYLAATPHFASAALVALREGRPIKDPQQGASSPSKAQQPQDGAHEASDDPIADVPPDAQADPSAGGAPEANTHEAAADVTNNKTPEGQHTQEIQDLTNASSLVEYPVYFVSMVL